jgi:hypothetical protein
MASSTTVLTGSIALPKLSVSVLQDSVYAALSQLVSVDNPEETVEEINTTNSDITDNYKTSEPGWITPGEWSFSFNYTESLWSQIEAIGLANTVNWRMSWTDPEHTTTDPQDEWTGYIKTKSKDQPLEGERHLINITILVSGKVTFTEGT